MVLVAQPMDGPRFVDRAVDFGMDNIGTGRGTVVLDFNGDGLADIYQTHSDRPNALYRNTGSGFVDVTESAGVGGDRFHWGASVGDYDNDGDPDMFVSVGGFEGSGRNLLYRNDGSSFTEVARPAGVAGPNSKSASPAWLDYDRDGWLDLFVVNFNPTPIDDMLPDCSKQVMADAKRVGEGAPSRRFDSASNFLYRNNRDGTFTDVTEEAGLSHTGRSFAVTAGDFDGDGFTDLYVASFKDDNMLYRNMQDGTFMDVAAAAGGLNEPFASMSPVFADFDNDGHLDLFVATWNALVPVDGGGTTTDFEFLPGDPNYLFRNLGDGTFTEIAVQAGVEHVGGHMGVQAADIDLDGWVDFYIGSGGPNPYEAQEDFLVMNNQNGGFDRVGFATSGIQNRFMAHGVAFADFDLDGDIDIFVGNGGPANDGDWANQPNRFYENLGPARNSITLAFEGVASNRSGLGVVVEASINDTTQRRELISGSGFASHNGLAMPLGFGAATRVDLMTVHWPSGVQQSLLDVPVNQTKTLIEPSIGVRVAPIVGLSAAEGGGEFVVDLLNLGKARRLHVELEIYDADHRLVDRLGRQSIALGVAASAPVRIAWAAQEEYSGRIYAVGRAIDASTGKVVNVGAVALDL